MRATSTIAQALASGFERVLCCAEVEAHRLNLSGVVEAVRRRGEDAIVLCAGFQGAFAIDDAYCAGRIVRELDGATLTDAATASVVIADRFPRAIDGINARTDGLPGLEADIGWCAQVDVVETVPRFSRMVGAATEIVPA